MSRECNLQKGKIKKKGNGGGMIMGIRREIMERGTEIKQEKKGIIVGRIKLGRERWRIKGVYVVESLKLVLDSIKK